MAVPQFGVAQAGRDYLDRPSVYALVRDRRGRVLCVRAGGGLHLPGGGVHAGESPEDAVLRELAEETGVVGEVVAPVRQASQYVVTVNKHATFFEVRATGTGPRAEADHEPVWLAPKRAARELAYEFHRWAVAPTVGARSGSLVVLVILGATVLAAFALFVAVVYTLFGWMLTGR